MVKYDTLFCNTAELNEKLNNKSSEGWEVDFCQLMNNVVGVFVLLKKEVIVIDGVDYTTKPETQDKRPGRKPMKNK